MITQASKLTGVQKAAIVLMNVGSEKAAAVLQQLTEAESEELVAEIVRMRTVPSTVAEHTIEEFYGMVTAGRVSSQGGRDFADAILEGAYGSERAAGMMGRVNSSMAGRSFEFLDSADANQILTLVDGEMPVTIALVLAHLKPAHGAAVLSTLPVELRTEVARCIATMSAPTPEAVSMVATSLKARSKLIVTQRSAAEVVGGVQPLVDIINRADAATEKEVLEGLDAIDKELADEVRSKLLTFADIVKLDGRDIQQVLSGMDASVLALALHGASAPVDTAIKENMSERNRTLLIEEISYLSNPKKSQVEEARSAVVRAIRALADSGTITVHRVEEDDE